MKSIKTILLLFPVLFISTYASAFSLFEETPEFLISTEPLYLLGGSPNIELSVKVHDQFSVGLHYSKFELSLLEAVFDLDNFDPDINSYGLRADWQPFGVFETGLYAAGIISYSQLDVTYTDPDTKNKYTGGVGGARLSGFGGVQWGGDLMFNRLGAGVSFQHISGLKIPISDSESVEFDLLDIVLPMIPTIEWTFGVHF
jgi:hypothetical protein